MSSSQRVPYILTLNIEIQHIGIPYFILYKLYSQLVCYGNQNDLDFLNNPVFKEINKLLPWLQQKFLKILILRLKLRSKNKVF